MDPFIGQKLQYMYDVFYDINHDGMISWEDFEDYITRITETNGWKKGDEKYTHALDTLTHIWDGLRAQADDNMDSEVSNQEWLKMWEGCVSAIESKGEIPAWLQKYEDFMFSVADTSGDGVIDHDEYHAAYVGYGLSDKNIEDSFNRTTQNGKVELNKANYAKLWNEFFSSKDKSLPGNYLFGHYDQANAPK